MKACGAIMTLINDVYDVYDDDDNELPNISAMFANLILYSSTRNGNINLYVI